MMTEEPNSPQVQSLCQIMEDVLGGLESEGFELVIVPLQVGEEVGTNARPTDEVPQSKGLEIEVRIHEVTEVESGVTSPSFFQVSHLFSSPAPSHLLYLFNLFPKTCYSHSIDGESFQPVDFRGHSFKMWPPLTCVKSFCDQVLTTKGEISRS